MDKLRKKIKTEPQSDNTRQAVALDKIKRGIKLFIFLTVISFCAVFYFTASSESAQALSRIHINYLILAISLGLLNHFWSCCQLYILIKKLEPNYRFIDTCQATFGNMFMAAITPTQSGGGPMQLILLKSKGLSFPKAIGAGFMQFLASVSFLFISILFLYLTQNQTIQNENISYLLNYGLVVMTGLGAIFILAILKPEAILRAVRIIAQFLARITPDRYDARIRRASEKLCLGIKESHCSIMLFLRKGKLAIAGSILFASGSMVTKFIIAYVIIIAFGYEAPFLKVINIQIILNFLIYFAPSPGASGVAEFGSAILMGMIVPKHFLGVFTVLWRLFTTFIGVGFGGLVILRFVAKFERNLVMITSRSSHAPQGENNDDKILSNK